MTPAHKARTLQGGRLLLSLVAISLMGSGAALALQTSTPAPVVDAEKELALIRQSSVLDDNNPEDAVAVQKTCTACHSAAPFLSAHRSFRSWNQVFGEMVDLGANPTDKQVDEIIRYFQRNLTIVNANTSPPDELAATLQLGEAATNALMARRAATKFSGIDDLAAMPGVNKDVLLKLGTNLRF